VPAFRAVVVIGLTAVAHGCGIGDGAGAGSSSSDAPAAVRSLLAIGKRIYDDGDYEAARNHFEAALSHFRSRGDTVGIALALTELGLAAYRLGDYRSARENGELARALKERLGLRGELFRSHNALGLLARQEGRYPDAIEHFEAAFEAARATDDSASIAKVACNLGLVHMALGDYASAKKGCRTAAEVAARLGETRTQGRALANLATLEIGTGDPARGLELLREARATADRAGDATAVAYITGEFAPAYEAVGEPERAIAHLDSAIAASRDLGFRQDEAANLELLAELHRKAGRSRRALALFAEARAIDEELGLTKRLASDYRSEASVYAELGDLTRARERATRALEIHRSLGARHEVMGDLLSLAEFASRAGDVARAGELLAEAKGLATELDVRTARLSMALSGARIAERAGEPQRTLQILDAAAGDLRAGLYGTEWEALSLRARALYQLGRVDSAIAVGRRALAAVERSRARYGSSQLRASVQARRAGVYGDLVEALLAAGREREAFEVSDASRGHALLEHLQVSDADALATVAARKLAESQVLLAQIDSLLVRRESLDAVPFAERTPEQERLLQLYETRLEENRAAYEAGLLRIQRDDPAAATLLGAGRSDAEEIQAALGPDEALLEYLVGPDKLVLFVLTPRAVRAIVTSIDRASLSSRVRVARDLTGAARAGMADGNAALEGLYRVLIEPVLQTGTLDDVRRLIVVPQRELHYLPFAALREPESGRHLVERFTILHLSVASALPVLRRRDPAISRDKRLAAAFAPFPRELPATRAEARAFERATGGRVHEGRSASESALRDALSRGGFVHVATHGVLNAWNPMFSRLELAAGPSDDGRLEVHELLYTRIRSHLVFLSGCETGAGTTGSTRFGSGEDYATLSQAFLYAGADNVVATLWRVEDEGAAFFATRFFEALSAGGPTEALVHAQRAALAEPRFARPFYWAGYRLDGAGHGPEALAMRAEDRRAQERGLASVTP
jgi:CHAT domain-containing protein/lipopolysaccharide biosynthesis regulator YciM